MSFINKIKGKISFMLGAIMTQMLLVKDAFAQFTPPAASDMSRQFINQIFGSLLDGGQDAFGSSIATFNGGVLIVGGILVSYTIIAGTIGTAHDGEMLGKKFSSVWIPIRTAMGTALILPVLPGGYCLMQGMVMWLVMQGVSLANTVWNAYMSSPPALVGKLNPTSKKIITKFVEDVYLAQVCVESFKAAHTTSPAELIGITTYNYSAQKNGEIWEFGENGGKLKAPRICGIITPPKKPEIKTTNSAATSLSSINGTASYFTSPDLTSIYDTHISQIANVVGKMQTLAAEAVKDGGNPNMGEIDTAVTTYENALLGAATALNSSITSRMADMASQQGWFLAGTWATQIIFMQNKINAALNSFGSADTYIVKKKDSWWDSVSKYASRGYQALSQRRQEFGNLGTDGASEETTETKKISPSGIVAKWLAEMITSIDLEQIKTDTRHPLIIMNQIGDSLFTAIMVGFGIIAAAGLGLGGWKILGSGPDLTPIFIAIYGTFGVPLVGFMGVAGMLSYILPNTPFFIWIGIIVGWTIMVIEAIIAAPLWAVMHLHPTGDDVAGKGSAGYMLVLGLLLRPVLIIFGLIAAIVLSEIFGKLINVIFFDLFSANTMDGTLGFFAILFGTALYATFMFTVLKNTFALMHTIPDQLLRWIGGGTSQLGQYANQISDGAVQKAGVAGGAALGFAMKDGLQGSLQGAKSIIDGNRQVNQLKSAEQDKKLSQLQNYQNKESSDGVGAGAADQAIDQAFGGNQFGAIEAKGMANDAANALGKDSDATAQYRQDLTNELSQGKSFPEAHQTALKNAWDSKFGEGSFDNAAKIAEKSGANSPKSFSLSMATTGQALGNKMNNLMKGRDGASPEQAQQVVSTMLSNVASTLSSQGGNPNKLLAQESKKASDVQSYLGGGGRGGGDDGGGGTV